MESMGYALEPIEMARFYEAGQLLYGGPWIAERLSGREEFVRDHPASIRPVIRSILADGARHHSPDFFRALHRLAELKPAGEPIWKRFNALVVPSASSHPRI